MNTNRILASLLACSLFQGAALARPTCATARSDETAPIAAAQRAMRELRYEDARDELSVALGRGHHSRDALVALHALRGEVGAISDGAEVGESEFRRLLVLMPDHAPPARNTPIFSVPFARARRWVAAHGSLKAEQKLQSEPRTGLPTLLVVAVTTDPLSMVSGARLCYRTRPDEPYLAAAGLALTPSLPAVRAGEALDYYLQLVDANDDVVLELGTADEPYRVELAAEPAPPPPRARPPAEPPTVLVAQPPVPAARHDSAAVKTAGWVIGGLGVATLGGAIAVDVTGRQRYDSLLGSCAPNCSQTSVDQLKQTANASIGMYTVGAAAVATSLILLVVDAAHRAHAK